ncbi:MAG: hypothetical protein COZ06_06100 [Armatimonadetes bacterium CG_4_10_14_3_um_filter_66_18]|nr:MAG: hypothetical protein COZ57_22510 [Armatimonadetes bacterium CG_4_8_14_3_um_filter_66_20]PIY51067.1 MAG: hypothetical protein COZ06_06100 [Armatimonadetes bacterium CG_4_10_14_3_um_filter_66_18]
MRFFCSTSNRWKPVGPAQNQMTWMFSALTWVTAWSVGGLNGIGGGVSGSPGGSSGGSSGGVSGGS